MTIKQRSWRNLDESHYGSQEIITFSHDLRDLGVRDVGGYFYNEKSDDNLGYARVKSNMADDNGRLMRIRSWPNNNSNSAPSDSAMRGQGATAINRTIPTSPIFSGATFLGELMQDGLPSAYGVETWREGAKFYRGLGSEYLNHEFGWVPFLSDIRNFGYAVRNHGRLLSNLQAGSGKENRVSYAFPSSFNTVASNPVVMTVERNNDRYYRWADSLLVEQFSRRTWFKGCFTYYIPIGDSASEKSQRFTSYADYLLGTRITPEVLWNLAPWSWAGDWFSNAGDVIGNISALGQDGLVLKYGYLMCEDIYRASLNTVAATTYHGGSNYKYFPALTWNRERKSQRRIGANPYGGFTLNPGPLSGRQSAILGALGLSRMR